MQGRTGTGGPGIKENRRSTVASQDLATILDQLPDRGAEDDVARLMDLYETAERGYRASMLASSPRIGSSASTNA